MDLCVLDMENKSLIGLKGESLFHGILSKYDLKDFTEDDINELKIMFDMIEDLDLSSKFHVAYTMVRSGMQDISEILLLLRQGKNIMISADTKEGTKSIDVSENVVSELQKMILLYLNERYGAEESMLSDEYLNRQVYIRNGIEEFHKELHGRKTINGEYSYIPTLGREVSSLLEFFNLQLSKLSSTSEQYRIIGDFICYNKKAPSCSPEEWESMGKKEQRRMIKSWIDSVNKFGNPTIDFSKEFMSACLNLLLRNLENKHSKK